VIERQKRQKDDYDDVIIEDQMENVQSKRKYNFDHGVAATKGKYYCNVIYITCILYIIF